MGRNWPSLESLTKIITAGAALFAALTVLYAVTVLHNPFTWEGALGKFTVAGARPLEPVYSPDSTVWMSECPEHTKAIAGNCISQSGAVPLRNFGADARYWKCDWGGPVPKADVQAVCIKTE